MILRRRERTCVRATLGVTLSILTVCSVTACGPSKGFLRFERAKRAERLELHPEYRTSIALLESARNNDRNKNEFVQYGMCEVATGMLGGYHQRVDEVGKHTYLAVQKYQDVDRERMAAMGNEAVKFFKGEPHERAMLNFYVGLACYLNGEYNDARIFFTQAILSTATRDEDMADFRDDFRLGHYWLGRAYLAMGQDDNARIAFGKTGRILLHQGQKKEEEKRAAARKRAYQSELKGEALCYKNGTEGKKPVADIVDLSQGCSRGDMPTTLPDAAESDPTVKRAETLEAFLDCEFQRSANLIIIVECGLGPYKYLHGSSGSLDDFERIDFKEEAVDIYVDGHHSGPAMRLLDTYHQAITRGVETRRGRQVGKAVAKEILSNLPLISMVAGHWDIQADGRYWPGLPGQTHVYAAQVEPGLHTIDLRFFDAAGQYLPRFDLARHYINVPEEGDLVLLIDSKENQDNAYVLSLPLPK